MLRFYRHVTPTEFSPASDRLPHDSTALDGPAGKISDAHRCFTGDTGDTQSLPCEPGYFTVGQMNLSVMRSQLLITLVALLALPLAARAQDDTPKKTFFLPKNATAAAYILNRLSNKELIAAPRSEFVYVALLQRKGLERKYRIEALQGLAAIHKLGQGPQQRCPCRIDWRDR